MEAILERFDRLNPNPISPEDKRYWLETLAGFLQLHRALHGLPPDAALFEGREAAACGMAMLGLYTAEALREREQADRMRVYYRETLRAYLNGLAREARPAGTRWHC